MATYDELQNRFGSSKSVDVLVPVLSGQVNKAATLFRLQRRDDAREICEEIWTRFGSHESPLVLLAAGTAVTIKSAVLSAQGRTSDLLAAFEELLNRLDQCERHVLAGKVADHDTEALSTLRLTTHGMRVLTYIKQGNMSAVANDAPTDHGVTKFRQRDHLRREVDVISGSIEM